MSHPPAHLEPPRLALALSLACALTACSSGSRYETAMCALVDVSGTYTEEMPAVTTIIRSGILPALRPGDSLFLIGITSDSYDEDNLWSKVTLDRRPSRANAQKLAFAEETTELLSEPTAAPLTDISGAMMLCGDYLQASGSGRKLMLVLSDMQEELRDGVERDFAVNQLSDIDVLALNVIRLKGDNRQPSSYRDRLATWEERLMAAGARGFRVLTDASSLPEIVRGEASLTQSAARRDPDDGSEAAPGDS